MHARTAEAFTTLVRWLVLVLSVVSGVGVLVMMATTCASVGLRLFGTTVGGALDILRISSAVTIACALPYTTAAKGHVSIEYFFLKLPRVGKAVVEAITRLLGVALFVFLSWQCLRYGLSMLRNGRVSLTLEIPIFWVPWVIAFSCGAAALVLLHNLLRPRQEIV